MCMFHFKLNILFKNEYRNLLGPKCIASDTIGLSPPSAAPVIISESSSGSGNGLSIIAIVGISLGAAIAAWCGLYVSRCGRSKTSKAVFPTTSYDASGEAQWSRAPSSSSAPHLNRARRYQVSDPESDDP